MGMSDVCVCCPCVHHLNKMKRISTNDSLITKAFIILKRCAGKAENLYLQGSNLCKQKFDSISRDGHEGLQHFPCDSVTLFGFLRLFKHSVECIISSITVIPVMQVHLMTVTITTDASVRKL